MLPEIAAEAVPSGRPSANADAPVASPVEERRRRTRSNQRGVRRMGSQPRRTCVGTAQDTANNLRAHPGLTDEQSRDLACVERRVRQQLSEQTGVLPRASTTANATTSASGEGQEAEEVEEEYELQI